MRGPPRAVYLRHAGGVQEVLQRKPDWSEFVEACFTPGSELNRRLKQMILNMGEEEKHK